MRFPDANRRVGGNLRIHSATDISEAASPPGVVEEMLRSSGQPLDPATRGHMERRFQHDFSKVRVHSGPRDAERTASVGARAFTVGQEIVFGNGEFDPQSRSGQRLLAHELTHVVQQTAGVTGRSRQLMRKPFDDLGTTGPTSPVLSGNKELASVWAGTLVIGAGATGDFVERIQLALLADNHVALPEFGADGKYGNETKAAISAYQRNHGLAVDGVVGRETIRSLDTRASAVVLAVPSVAAVGPQPGPKMNVESLTTPPGPNLIFPWYHAISAEQTFVKREFPPIVNPAITIYRTLSLVGSGKLSPVSSALTVSKDEMSLEFQKFGTSLTFKQGKTPQDISFSSVNVDLGKSPVSVTYGFLPPSCTVSYKLPKEIVLGHAKLSGDLAIKLEFKFVPNQRPQPEVEKQYVPQNEPPWLEVLKKQNRPLYLCFAVGLAALMVAEAVAERLVLPIIIIVPPTDDYSQNQGSMML